MSNDDTYTIDATGIPLDAEVGKVTFSQPVPPPHVELGEPFDPSTLTDVEADALRHAIGDVAWGMMNTCGDSRYYVIKGEQERKPKKKIKRLRSRKAKT